MILINEMFGDPNDITCKLGVCLKKSYPHLEYVKIETGNTCTDSIVENTVYLKNGLYIELYKNPNPLYHINTGDTSLCLVISESINSWVERYVNSLASTGYTGNLPSQIESRIIYDSTIGMYFKLSHIEGNVACSGDTQPVWAIYDNLTNDVWVSGGTNNYWFTEGGFDKVDSLDINPNSVTFDNIMTVFKCVICGLTLNITTQISHSGNYDGTATALASGGTEPYTYLWSDGQTTQTATGLTGNTQYSVSVTDSIGCNITGSTIVDECNLSIQFTSTNPDNLANDNGTATVTVNGGAAPYSYTWSNGQTVTGSSSNINTATNLSGSSEYSVSIIDGNGCTINENIVVGQSTFVFDADYMVLTYTFTDGTDLDTRTRIVTPDIGQDTEADYLGWGLKTYYPLEASGDTINQSVLYWGGDNTGVGTEAVLINLVRFKELYPTETNILVDCRCQWYGTTGIQDVYISAKLYKGGTMIRQADLSTGYNFDNTGYTSTYDITSVGKIITLHSTSTTSPGERIATLSYDLSTNSGLFNNNDTITPSV